MTINIQSNADYLISSENYKVEISKSKHEVVNEQVLEAIRLAVYQAFEQVLEQESLQQQIQHNQ